MTWYSHLLQKFPQFAVIHIVKGFNVANEAEVFFFFFWISLLFYDPIDVGNFICGPFAFSKSSFAFSKSIWKFLFHLLMKTSLKDFEHYLESMWNVHNCAVVWHSSAWVFFGIEMKTYLFQCLLTAELSKFAGILRVAL